MTEYRTSPADLEGMPPGVPPIIGNEAAERFSFYGMKAILAIFMANYLHLMDGTVGTAMSEPEATEKVHLFNGAVYLTPFLGAILADAFLGKYRTIILLSLVYCAGHAALAFMGTAGYSSWWLFAGLGMIALGSGGIKPCVSAHVGDQFGNKNAHLLPRVFNWFYFSINLGAMVSMILTPWLLEWYGPHWAFGVPGVLMGIATFIFWLGRHRFIHVPPGGMKFVRELFSREGGAALLKLLPLYAFVAVFWALFDQTSSTWIFQAEEMDRDFLGREWLPSQIQSVNSVFVLTFIPLFTYVVYPLVSRIYKLTALRKIGIGLFVMAASFGLVALIQEWIDAGGRPNIGWQVLAFALLTAAEIMVSIVALEFAYTQAPRTMKSLVMCYYLGAVAAGNFLVAGINHYIRIPDAAEEQLEAAIESLPEDWRDSPRNVVLPGHDGTTGTGDDLIARLSDGAMTDLFIPGRMAFDFALGRVDPTTTELPDTETGAERLASVPVPDAWGNPIVYERLNASTARLISAGPDRTPGTQWDLGLIVTLPEIAVEDDGGKRTWLERRKAELGMTASAPGARPELEITAFSGGQTKLQGAAYFRFFALLMLGTAVAYIPFALVYRPKTYLQD